MFERMKMQKIKEGTNFVDLNKEGQGKFTISSRTSAAGRLNT